MKIRFLLVLMLLAAPAAAQTAPETALSDFVESHSATTRLGKIARWEEPVCPSVVGLPANFIKFITKRVRDVAAQVGAPVDPDEACKSNVEVVFTTKPQPFLDSVRATNPFLLGYYDNTSQADRMAVVNFPIQGWHATQTVDLRGKKTPDSRDTLRSAQASSGSRLADGSHSSFFHGFVVANPDKLGQFEIGALGDYVAMLALSQPASQDLCQQMPSILDITKPDCRKDKPVLALTPADMGYLRGLYRSDPGASLRSQQDAIAFQIRETQAGR